MRLKSENKTELKIENCKERRERKNGQSAGRTDRLYYEYIFT